MIWEVLLCRRRGGGRKGELELTYLCVLHHCETCSLLLFGVFDTALKSNFSVSQPMVDWACIT